MDASLPPLLDHPGVFTVLVIGLLVLVTRTGYAIGRRSANAKDEARSSQIGAIQASVLGMLALLLGFTFSMAAERYDSRRTLVMEEANAIQAAWLRAGMLPDAHRLPVRSLLRRYVEVLLRPDVAIGNGGPVSARPESSMQRELWQHAEASAAEAANDITATFVEALNEVIALDRQRLAAARNRIPASVWAILLVVAGVGSYITAYANGADAPHSAFATVLLPVLLGVVILVIIDLTNEQRGVISVSQQPLIDLLDSLPR